MLATFIGYFRSHSKAAKAEHTRIYYFRFPRFSFLADSGQNVWNNGTEWNDWNKFCGHICLALLFPNDSPTNRLMKIFRLYTDGTIRSFGSGHVMLAEDTTGRGHIARFAGDQSRQ